ncbi:MAG: hypothetical protein JST68_12085 [Bacteroidetes bacterium]|nr:hypothetical protein [Bacteroidota bacterium]
MKKLLMFLLVVAGSFFATSAYSQVHVDVNFEKDYPGYTYYTYPKWHGHYKDKEYYAHYKGRFEKEHKSYFHGHDFDHDRWDRDHHRKH